MILFIGLKKNRKKTLRMSYCYFGIISIWIQDIYPSFKVDMTKGIRLPTGQFIEAPIVLKLDHLCSHTTIPILIDFWLFSGILSDWKDKMIRDWASVYIRCIDFYGPNQCNLSHIQGCARTLSCYQAHC